MAKESNRPEGVHPSRRIALMSYIVYILRFFNNSLYIGQTNNLKQRLIDHKNRVQRASKFSKENGEFELVYREEYPTRIEAMRREKQLKGWTRAKKEALISENLKLLKRLSRTVKKERCQANPPLGWFFLVVFSEFNNFIYLF